MRTLLKNNKFKGVIWLVVAIVIVSACAGSEVHWFLVVFGVGLPLGVAAVYFHKADLEKHQPVTKKNEDNALEMFFEIKALAEIGNGEMIDGCAEILDGKIVFTPKAGREMRFSLSDELLNGEVGNYLVYYKPREIAFIFLKGATTTISILKHS